MSHMRPPRGGREREMWHRCIIEQVCGTGAAGWHKEPHSSPRLSVTRNQKEEKRRRRQGEATGDAGRFQRASAPKDRVGVRMHARPQIACRFSDFDDLLPAGQSRRITTMCR